MTSTRKLLIAFAFASLVPAATAVAQPAARAAAAAAAAEPADTMTAQEREVLAAAEQLATEGSQLLDQWITAQAISELRLFSRLYFPVGKAEPQKYATPYDTLADRDLVGPEDKALGRSPLLQYAIITSPRTTHGLPSRSPATPRRTTSTTGPSGCSVTRRASPRRATKRRT
jgi:hypothetical protein